MFDLTAKKFGYTSFASFWLVLFCLLFGLTMPFGHSLLPDTGAWTDPAFSSLARFSLGLLAKPQPGISNHLISDGTLLYVHAFNLLVISLLISLIPFRKQHQILPWMFEALKWFVILMMMDYGAAKLFKTQFYIPEPNVLFSRFGNLDRDFLFWSTNGLSLAYNRVTGLTEIVAALLLVFRGTRLAGLLLTLFVTVQVLAINLSFDISVKLLSAHLCLSTLLLLFSHRKRLSLLFIHSGTVNIPDPTFSPNFQKWKPAAMSLLLVFCLADAFWPYFRDANFKGDLAPTPPLHGAYKVVSFVKNGDTIAPDLRETKRWKMAFVHRQGYFIVQYMDESMEDYEMAFEHQTELLLSQNHHASGALKVETTILNSAPVLGKLSGMIGKDSIIVNLEYVDWKQLPAVQPDFHWTSDQ